MIKFGGKKYLELYKALHNITPLIPITSMFMLTPLQPGIAKWLKIKHNQHFMTM
jgi:hypothetical protein